MVVSWMQREREGQLHGGQKYGYHVQSRIYISTDCAPVAAWLGRLTGRLFISVELQVGALISQTLLYQRAVIGYIGGPSSHWYQLVDHKES